MVVTSKKSLSWPNNRAEKTSSSFCLNTPEIRVAHLAHGSLQNRIETALRSISVAGNLLFLNFFIETVDFIR